jgi:hypothetical protein
MKMMSLRIWWHEGKDIQKDGCVRVESGGEQDEHDDEDEDAIDRRRGCFLS